MAAVFSPRHLRATLCFWGALFLGMMLVYGLNTWLPQIMRKNGYDLGSSLSFLLVFSLASAIGGLVLGQRQCFAVAQLGGERPAPCLPRCAFEAQACGVIDSYVVHGQVDAQRCALLLAVPHPVVGRGLQAMVHPTSSGASSGTRAGKAVTGQV
ncbi:hypothetical protein G6F24_016325 [Rhizopus arrhizus]|nr:hypothetical protein G6F24_016325 [Rhizopus arrhizus]